MNPSASGWIDKFGQLVENQELFYTCHDDLYHDLSAVGFVYGISVDCLAFIPKEHATTEDENAKANLWSALYFTYRISSKNGNYQVFLEKVLGFYKELNINPSFLNKLLSGSKTSNKLEQIISSRVFLEDNFITKAFGSNIINSLLFVDVLTFRRFLVEEENIKDTAKNIELMAINMVHHTLNSKEQLKTDERLSYLFKASLSYVAFENIDFDSAYSKLDKTSFDQNTAQYYLDLICLTAWQDMSLDYKESAFVFGVGDALNFDKKKVKKNIKKIEIFLGENIEKIPYLKDHNFAEKIYDRTSKIVQKLIYRNRKRLGKELSESKELVALISKSTITNLSTEEKKKVQSQLMDIIKSIPSLAIFMLPGGAILLPIFIKLVPKLLPSSFDENRIEK